MSGGPQAAERVEVEVGYYCPMKDIGAGSIFPSRVSAGVGKSA